MPSYWAVIARRLDTLDGIALGIVANLIDSRTAVALHAHLTQRLAEDRASKDAL